MSDADKLSVTLEEVVVLVPLLIEMLGLVGTVVSVSVVSSPVVEDEDEDELPKSLSFPENPHPEKYIKKVPCQSCNGSGVRYHGGVTNSKADKHFGDPYAVEQENLVHS